MNLGRLPEHAISLRQGATRMLIQINEGLLRVKSGLFGKATQCLLSPTADISGSTSWMEPVGTRWDDGELGEDAISAG